MYKSKFKPNAQGLQVLLKGRILGLNESSSSMVERIVTEIFKIEKKFKTGDEEIARLIKEFGVLIDEKKIIPSTPILTNAGRFRNKPLSACIVPPVEIKNDLSRVGDIANDAHRNGMGTGYCFDETEDPVKALNYLNSLAVEGAQSGREDRPVGNIAVLSARHHKIKEFIFSKVNNSDREWRFNISISIDDHFIDQLKRDEMILIKNGKKMSAQKIFQMIVRAAHKCADPGLVFIDRLNNDNPTPAIGEYKTVAPCGEVGLSEGEFCQFMYINVGEFIDLSANGTINYEKLRRAVEIVTRVLDNTLEISIERSKSKLSQFIMSQKRKIGIGICGFADLLAALSVPYDSKQGRKIAEEIMSFINYYSKTTSVSLAKKRGSFLALRKMGMSRYDDSPSYLEKKYIGKETASISDKMWRNLARQIKTERLLRNASTTALPPTGRSAQIIGASTGIEPFFSLLDYSGNLNESLANTLAKLNYFDDGQILKNGKINDIKPIPSKIKRSFKTALEINYIDHLLMAASFQKHVDESISKTINLPADSGEEDIKNAFLLAYELGLKGITIYRSGSKKIEPRKLAN